MAKYLEKPKSVLTKLDRALKSGARPGQLIKLKAVLPGFEVIDSGPPAPTRLPARSAASEPRPVGASRVSKDRRVRSGKTGNTP